MVAHTNFFETVKEAEMRLLQTVVLYEGKPYYVLGVCDHKADGIYRIYLDDLLDPRGPAYRRHGQVQDMIHYSHGGGTDSKGNHLDKWLDANPSETVIRKMMNSPYFNKFRPFPLGMVNYKGKVIYTERQPTRSTYQGLTQNMINHQPVNILPDSVRGLGRSSLPMESRELAKTIVGDYPTAEECLSALADDQVSNEGAAFHRLFAFFRGPLDMIFVAYKGDIIGSLPNHDLSVISIGKNFKHCREVVQELGVFGEIKTR